MTQPAASFASVDNEWRTDFPVLQQTVNAYKNDIGISTDFDPVDIFNPIIGSTIGDNIVDPELSAETVQNVVIYLQTLRPPERRNENDPQVLQGETLFSTIGCASCQTLGMRIMLIIRRLSMLGGFSTVATSWSCSIILSNISRPRV